MAKLKLLVSVTVDQDGWLRARAAKLGISISEILRRMIDEKIDEKREQPLRRK